MTVVQVERPPNVPKERVVEFDLFNAPGAERDFHRAWSVLQNDGTADLVWTPFNGGHWIATRGQTIRTVYSDYRSFSSRVVLLPKASGEFFNMLPLTLDPPQHRPFRNLLNGGLAPKIVAQMEDKVRSFAVALIEEVKPQGGCEFITHYAEKLPMDMLMTIAALPLSDAALLKRLVNQMTRPDGSMPFDEAMQTFHDYMRKAVRERAGGNGTDIISQVVNGMIRERHITEDEAVHMCTEIMVAGLDTVANMLGFVMLALAQQPALRARLIENPGLIEGSLDEFFRRYASVTMAREVVRDMEFAGVHLKKGEMIAVPTFLAGLDARENKCPFEMDLSREQIFHATFGAGVHSCPGKYLGLLELRVTLEEWLARIPEFKIQEGHAVRMTGGIVGSVNELPLVWD